MSEAVLTPALLNPLRIGLSPLDLADWVIPRAGDDLLLAERRALAADHAGEVLALRPDGTAPLRELAGLLRARGFTLPGDDGLPLLAALAGAVAEDLLLLLPAAETYVLVAGTLCFPNRWRLADKIGKGLAAIHGPVPEYEAALAGPVDRFLARLRPERAFTRSNWGLTSSPDLHLPLPVTPVDPSADTAFFLRREEQSFVKLPETEAVVFAIRTTVIPWTAVATEEQAAIREVAGLLSPSWRDYKSLR